MSTLGRKQTLRITWDCTFSAVRTAYAKWLFCAVIEALYHEGAAKRSVNGYNLVTCGDERVVLHGSFGKYDLDDYRRPPA